MQEKKSGFRPKPIPMHTHREEMGKERSRDEVHSRLRREFVEKLHLALDPYANKGLFWALGALLVFQHLTYARIATIEKAL